MKTLISIIVSFLLLTSCNPVTVPVATKSDNYNVKQAKAIISSQKAVRKKQLKAAKKHRKEEIQEIKALSKK